MTNFDEHDPEGRVRGDFLELDLLSDVDLQGRQVQLGVVLKALGDWNKIMVMRAKGYKRLNG